MKYDDINWQIAANKYGSAFLAYTYFQGNNYEVSLVAISYYSAPNSRVFKVINITWNEQCISLNQDSYFEFTPEDQLAVSFICGAYLQIYRVCMRPHVVIDFSEYVKDEHTDGFYQLGAIG